MTIPFGEIEVEPDKLPVIAETNPHDSLVPEYGSLDWNDYVLSLLAPEEKPQGHPTCAGLRRIVENLLGEFIFNGPIQVFPSSDSDGPGRATVLYEVVFAWKLNLPEWIDVNNDIPTKAFRDVAESWSGNTPSPFDKHVAATASTRAEGRVLKKALKLRVATAEEMNAGGADTIVTTIDSNQLISSFQKNFIKSKCQVLGISVEKFIKCSDIHTIKYVDATVMLETLSTYQRIGNIPEEIRL